MPTMKVTSESFDAITARGVVLLEWWADWCGPCRTFAPVYEAAAARHPDVVFGKIDTDAEDTLAADFGIRAIPTVMAFRDGVLVFAQSGVMSAQLLDRLIATVKGLQMGEVRKMIQLRSGALG